jgi:hypothetical protein
MSIQHNCSAFNHNDLGEEGLDRAIVLPSQCVKEIIKLINLIKIQIMIIWFDFN